MDREKSRYMLALTATLGVMALMAVATAGALAYMWHSAPAGSPRVLVDASTESLPPRPVESDSAAPPPPEPIDTGQVDLPDEPSTTPEPEPEPDPESRSSAQPTPSRATTRTTNTKKKKRCREFSGVTRHSSTRYTLSDGFVEYYIRDQEKAGKQGNGSWVEDRNGKKTGLRLTRVACAPRAAGFRKNDEIRKVDGRSIDSLSNAWASYRSVKKANAFTVELRRKGKTLEIRYTVK